MDYSPEKFPPRPRITEALTRSFEESRLVVVTAPLGYGKSIVCRDVAAATAGCVLRLAPKPSWRDPDIFWEAAFKEFSRQGFALPQAFPRAGFPADGVSMYQVLSQVRELVAGKMVTLVIDDYQYASSKPVDEFIEALVREELPELNLLLFTRTRPHLPLETLQMQGHAALFGPDLLLFTRDEARELFAKFGVPDTDIADQALSFSEGWAAALWISLQRYREQGLLEPVRDIEKIIDEMFFAGYGEEDRKLLMQLSFLDSFTSDQAAVISGDPGASGRLGELCKHNPFLYYNDITDSCSMHGLFRSYLAGRVKDVRTAQAYGIVEDELHRRAARCAQGEGNELEAIRRLAQAGGEEDLLNILKFSEKPEEGLLLRDSHNELYEIIQSIPWTVRRRCPVGYLGFIHRYMVRVDRQEAAKMLDEVEKKLGASSDLPPELLAELQGEIELIHAVLDFNDFPAMCRRWENARELLKGRSRLVSERMFWTFNSPHSAFLYLKEPGEYGRLLETARAGLGAFDEVSGGANAGAYDLLLAEHHLETGNDLEIAHHLRKGEFKARQSDQRRGLVTAAFIEARRQLAQGHPEEAMAELQTLAGQVAKTGHPLLRYMMELCQGYIASVCNRFTDLPAWLFGEDISPQQGFLRNSDFCVVVQGRALMGVKDWTRLEAHAETAATYMEKLGSLFGKIHVSLCRAIAAHHRQIGNPKAAEAHLLKACELAAPDGIITSIAEYGGHLLPLLQRLEHLNPYDTYIAVLTRRTKKYARLDSEDQLNLTSRERDILERAASGASNKEIGEALGIVPGSVANTLSRVYSKLGVDCRLGAIRKWSHEGFGQAI